MPQPQTPEAEARILAQIRAQYLELLEQALKDNRSQLLQMVRRNPKGLKFSVQLQAQPILPAPTPQGMQPPMVA